LRQLDTPASRALLSLPALLYGATIRVRNRFYERPGAAHRAPLPVLSVGNLTLGGTGKTPLVAWLANGLLAAGRRPAILSRGYGGRAGRGPLIVSEGGAPLCSPADCGDEPYLLARSLADTLVLAGSDRLVSASKAAEMGANVAILDDGFQHRRLARDLDLVLLDASDPFGNYRLLPAGTLREPISALGRADLVLITRSRAGERFAVIERVVRQHNTAAPILRAGHRPLGYFDSRGAEVERPTVPVVAFCGIGNPARFRIDLEAEGLELARFEVHRDHHSYTMAELSRLAADARQHRAVLVTTEKDLVRLQTTGLPEPLDDPPLLALRIEATVFEPEPLLQAVHRALARRAA
jgi:tetraacyldisaccharide 4'-kinase